MAKYFDNGSNSFVKILLNVDDAMEIINGLSNAVSITERH